MTTLRERISKITGETDHAALNDIEYFLGEEGISEINFTSAHEPLVREIYQQVLAAWAENAAEGAIS